MTDKWDSPDGRTHSEGDGCGEAHGREAIEAVIERCEALRVVGAQDGEGTALVDAGDLRTLIACAKALKPFGDGTTCLREEHFRAAARAWGGDEEAQKEQAAAPSIIVVLEMRDKRIKELEAELAAAGRTASAVLDRARRAEAALEASRQFARAARGDGE